MLRSCAHRSPALLTWLLVGLFATPHTWADAPQFEGLVLWLDAEDLDADGASRNEVATGTGLGRWADKSGRANHVVQRDESRQPAIQRGQGGGKTVLRFDGDDLLTREQFAGFAYRDQPIHMVVVMQSSHDASRPLPRVIEFQPVDGDLAKPATVKQHGLWIGSRGNGQMRIGTHYGDEGSALSVAWNAQPHVVEVVYEGAQGWVHYLDGRRDGAGLLGGRDFHGFTKGLRLAIGQQYDSTDPATFFEGDLAEILIYNRVLSVEEHNAVKTNPPSNYRDLVEIERRCVCILRRHFALDDLFEKVTKLGTTARD